MGRSLSLTINKPRRFGWNGACSHCIPSTLIVSHVQFSDTGLSISTQRNDQSHQTDLPTSSKKFYVLLIISQCTLRASILQQRPPIYVQLLSCSGNLHRRNRCAGVPLVCGLFLCTTGLYFSERRWRSAYIQRYIPQYSLVVNFDSGHSIKTVLLDLGIASSRGKGTP